MSSRRTNGYDGALRHGYIQDEDGLFDELLRLVPGTGNPQVLGKPWRTILQLGRRKPFTTRQYLTAMRETPGANGDTASLMAYVQSGQLAFVKAESLCVRAGKPVVRRSAPLAAE